MTYQEVMAQIQAGVFHSVYLITGEETYLADRLEKALVAKLLPNEADLPEMRSGAVAIEELAELIESAPFFSERNVIVVKNTALFKEKKKSGGAKAKEDPAEEKLIALIERMPPYSVLILLSGEKADKRRKLYKTIAKAGCAVEIAPIRPWEVKDWLQGKLREIGRRFDRDAHSYFLEATSMMHTVSLGFLDQEVEKLALYRMEGVIERADVERVMASIPEVSVFAMLEAISDRDSAKALQVLLEQLDAGAHPLRILALLTRHVHQLWQAKRLIERGVSGRQLAGELGVALFIADKLAAKSRFFAEETLRAACIQIADADYQLKSGQADAAVLERIVIELCAAQKAKNP